MVFMHDRRAEQRENAVAGRLHDVAFVAPHRLNHQLQHRVDDGACFLGVEVFHQLGRTLDVGEQRRDGLALTFEHFKRRLRVYSNRGEIGLGSNR